MGITLRVGSKCRLLLQCRQYSELTTMASRSEVDLPDLGIWMTATVPCRQGNIYP